MTTLGLVWPQPHSFPALSEARTPVTPEGLHTGAPSAFGVPLHALGVPAFLPDTVLTLGAKCAGVTTETAHFILKSFSALSYFLLLLFCHTGKERSRIFC